LVVRKCPGDSEQWCVMSKEGEILGRHDAKKDALEQLAAVEAAQADDTEAARELYKDLRNDESDR